MDRVGLKNKLVITNHDNFATEYLKRPVLWDKRASFEEKKKALIKMADALGVDINLRVLYSQCAKFKRAHQKKVRGYVLATIANKKLPEFALKRNGVPQWVRDMDAELQVLPKILHECRIRGEIKESEGQATWTTFVSTIVEKCRGARKVPDFNDIYPVADSLGLKNYDQLFRLWNNQKETALCKYRCLSEIGDKPSQDVALTRMEWSILDVIALYSEVFSVINDTTLKCPPQEKQLAELYHLVKTYKVEESGGDSAENWGKIVRMYSRNYETSPSGIILQLRWHELKKLTSENIQMRMKDQTHKVHPLMVEIAAKYPHVLKYTETWQSMVLSGKVYDVSNLSEQLYNTESETVEQEEPGPSEAMSDKIIDIDSDFESDDEKPLVIAEDVSPKAKTPIKKDLNMPTLDIPKSDEKEILSCVELNDRINLIGVEKKMNDEIIKLDDELKSELNFIFQHGKSKSDPNFRTDKEWEIFEKDLGIKLKSLKNLVLNDDGSKYLDVCNNRNANIDTKKDKKQSKTSKSDKYKTKINNDEKSSSKHKTDKNKTKLQNNHISNTSKNPKTEEKAKTSSVLIENSHSKSKTRGKDENKTKMSKMTKDHKNKSKLADDKNTNVEKDVMTMIYSCHKPDGSLYGHLIMPKPLNKNLVTMKNKHKTSNTNTINPNNDTLNVRKESDIDLLEKIDPTRAKSVLIFSDSEEEAPKSNDHEEDKTVFNLGDVKKYLSDHSLDDILSKMNFGAIKKENIKLENPNRSCASYICISDSDNESPVVDTNTEIDNKNVTLLCDENVNDNVIPDSDNYVIDTMEVISRTVDSIYSKIPTEEIPKTNIEHDSYIDKDLNHKNTEIKKDLSSEDSINHLNLIGPKRIRDAANAKIHLMASKKVVSYLGYINNKIHDEQEMRRDESNDELLDTNSGDDNAEELSNCEDINQTIIDPKLIMETRVYLPKLDEVNSYNKNRRVDFSINTKRLSQLGYKILNHKRKSDDPIQMDAFQSEISETKNEIIDENTKTKRAKSITKRRSTTDSTKTEKNISKNSGNIKQKIKFEDDILTQVDELNANMSNNSKIISKQEEIDKNKQIELDQSKPLENMVTQEPSDLIDSLICDINTSLSYDNYKSEGSDDMDLDTIDNDTLLLDSSADQNREVLHNLFKNVVNTNINDNESEKLMTDDAQITHDHKNIDERNEEVLLPIAKDIDITRNIDDPKNSVKLITDNAQIIDNHKNMDEPNHEKNLLPIVKNIETNMNEKLLDDKNTLNIAQVNESIDNAIINQIEKKQFDVSIKIENIQQEIDIPDEEDINLKTLKLIKDTNPSIFNEQVKVISSDKTSNNDYHENGGLLKEIGHEDYIDDNMRPINNLAQMLKLCKPVTLCLERVKVPKPDADMSQIRKVELPDRFQLKRKAPTAHVAPITVSPRDESDTTESEIGTLLHQLSMETATEWQRLAGTLKYNNEIKRPKLSDNHSYAKDDKGNGRDKKRKNLKRPKTPDEDEIKWANDEWQRQKTINNRYFNLTPIYFRTNNSNTEQSKKKISKKKEALLVKKLVIEKDDGVPTDKTVAINSVNKTRIDNISVNKSTIDKAVTPVITETITIDDDSNSADNLNINDITPKINNDNVINRENTESVINDITPHVNNYINVENTEYSSKLMPVFTKITEKKAIELIPIATQVKNEGTYRSSTLKKNSGTVLVLPERFFNRNSLDTLGTKNYEAQPSTSYDQNNDDYEIKYVSKESDDTLNIMTMKGKIVINGAPQSKRSKNKNLSCNNSSRSLLKKNVLGNLSDVANPNNVSETDETDEDMKSCQKDENKTDILETDSKNLNKPPLKMYAPIKVVKNTPVGNTKSEALKVLEIGPIGPKVIKRIDDLISEISESEANVPQITNVTTIPSSIDLDDTTDDVNNKNLEISFVEKKNYCDDRKVKSKNTLTKPPNSEDEDSDIDNLYIDENREKNSDDFTIQFSFDRQFEEPINSLYDTNDLNITSNMSSNNGENDELIIPNTTDEINVLSFKSHLDVSDIRIENVCNSNSCLNDDKILPDVENNQDLNSNCDQFNNNTPTDSKNDDIKNTDKVENNQNSIKESEKDEKQGDDAHSERPRPFLKLVPIQKLLNEQKEHLDPLNVNDPLDPLNLNESTDQLNLNGPIDPLNLNEPIDQLNFNKPINQLNFNEPFNQLKLDEPMNQLICNEPINELRGAPIPFVCSTKDVENDDNMPVISNVVSLSATEVEQQAPKYNNIRIVPAANRKTTNTKNTIVNHPGIWRPAPYTEHRLKMIRLLNYNEMSTLPHVRVTDFIKDRDCTNLSLLCLDDTKPLWKVQKDYLVLTTLKLPIVGATYWTLASRENCQRILMNQTSQGSTVVGEVSVPDELYLDSFWFRKLSSDPMIYAKIWYVVPDSKVFQDMVNLKVNMKLFSTTTGSIMPLTVISNKDLGINTELTATAPNVAITPLPVKFLTAAVNSPSKTLDSNEVISLDSDDE